MRESLDELLKHFQIIHLCGKGKVEPSLQQKQGYVQFEYIKKELSDLFACTDLMISRAGANAICEILSLRKPNILIPLSAAASRGDQILNARSFEKQGYSFVIEEESLTKESLIDAVQTVYKNRNSYVDAMNKSELADPIQTIMGLIEENRKK